MSGKKVNPVILGISLAVIAAVSTAVMAYAYTATKAPIDHAKAERLLQSFRRILPEFDNDVASTKVEVPSAANGRPVAFYTAEKDGKVVAYAAVTGVGSGYGGEVTGLLGFSPDGKILSYSITSHNETPGLGSKATNRVRQETIFTLFGGGDSPEKASGTPPNVILDSFLGHSAESSDSWRQPWAVRKDGGSIDHISGATVSSRAVTGIAWNAAKTFSTFRKEQQKGGK